LTCSNPIARAKRIDLSADHQGAPPRAHGMTITMTAPARHDAAGRHTVLTGLAHPMQGGRAAQRDLPIPKPVRLSPTLRRPARPPAIGMAPAVHRG